MSFFEKSSIFFKIDKSGNFAVECESNDITVFEIAF